MPPRDNSKPATLYRLFAEDGSLLYVGASMYTPGRLETHRREKSWWPLVAKATFEHYETRHGATVAEADAIRDEEPRFNVAPGHPVAALSEEDEALRRISDDELTERRHARTMYRVPDLHCTRCGWKGGWVAKGKEIADAPCPHCGFTDLSGTPDATKAAA